MSDTTGAIAVETVEEHEDGSATYQFQMDAHARGLLTEEGLKLVLYCAAAKMDLQLVYDFIEDHIRYERDKKCVSCGGPALNDDWCSFCLEEE
tara:strand:- start:104 stop:382 length:279 start_codon:yes stop_codon:yes gene_type:complete